MEPIVRVRNITYVYNDGEKDAKTALKNVSFDVESGGFVALCGHNGSGKSTVAKLLNGLLQPKSGEITVDGLTTADPENHFKIRSTLGVVFQNPDNQMIASIIEDDIAFGPENLGLPPKEISERVDWALAAVGMSEFRKGTPFRLSGGQKQRIAIAGVLAIRPRVLVLDEATSMLDPKGRREVLDVVTRLCRDEGIAVVMITHFMEEAALADRVIILNNGEVAENGGRELFDSAARLERYGLELPFAARVAEKLRAAGVPLPSGIVFADELTEQLCRL